MLVGSDAGVKGKREKEEEKEKRKGKKERLANRLHASRCRTSAPQCLGGAHCMSNKGDAQHAEHAKRSTRPLSLSWNGPVAYLLESESYSEPL